ncbi:hypothetical protein FO519_009033 [Halicephalobus sp. NKZ332]|nr:hypothetical protein FO519_009033 [Halicephalobus sp. NKZ332]
MNERRMSSSNALVRANGAILKDLCVQFMNNSIRRPYDLKTFLLSGIEPYFVYLEIISSVKSVIVEAGYYAAVIRTIDEDVEIYIPKDFSRVMSFNFGLYARSVVVNARPDRFFINGLRFNNYLEELEWNWNNKSVFFSVISKPRVFRKLSGRDFILRTLLCCPIFSEVIVVSKSDSRGLIPMVSKFCPRELFFKNCDNVLDEVAGIFQRNPRKFVFETRRADLDENLIYYFYLLKRVFPDLREISILTNSLNYMVPPESLQILDPEKLKEFTTLISSSILKNVKINLDFRRFLYLGVLYDLDFVQNYAQKLRQLFNDPEITVDGKLGIVASLEDNNVTIKIDLRVEPPGYVVYPKY